MTGDKESEKKKNEEIIYSKILDYKYAVIGFVISVETHFYNEQHEDCKSKGQLCCTNVIETTTLKHTLQLTRIKSSKKLHSCHCEALIRKSNIN